MTVRTIAGCDTTDVPGTDTTTPIPDSSGDSGPVDPSCDPTTPDLEGPFHVADTPNQANLRVPEVVGDPLVLNVRIDDRRCEPVEGAVFELWHADGNGDYHDDRCRCTLVTGEDGALNVRTVWPGRYLDATGWRPAHFHVKVSLEGQELLTTQLYFEGDPYLFPNDSCSVCASDDPARIMAVDMQDGVAMVTQTLTLDID